jgi:hypothetical protein
MLDREGSIRLARRLKPEHSRCWYNAARAVSDIPDLHDAWYVEGVAVIEDAGRVHHIDHGWIETVDGTILDPTLARFPGVRRPVVESILDDGTIIWCDRFPARYPLPGGQRHWPMAYFIAERFTCEGMLGALASEQLY